MTDGSPVAHGHLRSIADSVTGTFPGCEDTPLARVLVRQLALAAGGGDRSRRGRRPRREQGDRDAPPRQHRARRQGPRRRVRRARLRPTAHAFKAGTPPAHLVRMGHAIPAGAPRSVVARAIPVPDRRRRRPTRRRPRQDRGADQPLAVRFHHPKRPAPKTWLARSAAACTSSSAPKPRRWRAGHQGAVLGLDDAFDSDTSPSSRTCEPTSRRRRRLSWPGVKTYHLTTFGCQMNGATRR